MSPADKRYWPQIVALILFAVAMVACTMTRNNDPAVSSFALATPSALGTSVSAFQQLRLEQTQLERQFTLALDIGPDRLQLVIMSTIGQRLATWRYKDNHYQLQIEAGAPTELPYRLVLVATQLVFWPIDALDNANSKDWRISGTRVYYRDTLVAKLSRPVLQTTSWEGEYRVEFPASEVTLALQSTQLF
jgi:hypothetical protein